jgi:hypothetical protein
MNLNRLGAGRKLIQKVIDHGNVKNMRWTKQQQQDALNTQKNPHSVKSRLDKCATTVARRLSAFSALQM